MRTVLTAIVVTIVVSRSVGVLAWAPAGHQIVAELAERNLAPNARAELARLIGDGTRLAEIADWADKYRENCVNTGGWHYVNIPLAAERYEGERVCPAAKSCVVRALDRSLALLGDATRSTAERGFAVRLVVHLVGDLHQPLHSGDRGDRGGNDLHVSFEGQTTTLHGVWDYNLIAASDTSPEAYVARLARASSAAERARLQAGGPAAWALETQRAARRAYQGIPEARNKAQPFTLPGDYPARMRSVLDGQLLRAGLRLAKVLNTTLGTPSRPASDDVARELNHCERKR